MHELYSLKAAGGSPLIGLDEDEPWVMASAQVLRILRTASKRSPGWCTLDQHLVHVAGSVCQHRLPPKGANMAFYPYGRRIEDDSTKSPRSCPEIL